MIYRDRSDALFDYEFIVLGINAGAPDAFARGELVKRTKTGVEVDRGAATRAVAELLKWDRIL